MPEPKKGETEREYLKRCIPYMVNEGYEQRVAVPICYSKYRKSGTGAKSPKPEKKSYSGKDRVRNKNTQYGKMDNSLSKEDKIKLLVYLF